MVSLKVQKRLAASVLHCGQRKIWLDPNETPEIGLANSRKAVRKLIKDGFIVKKAPIVHSRARTRVRLAAKKLGRHCGHGKRKGTKEARMPTKTLWITRMRVLRRLLKKYRKSGKIDRHLYQATYKKIKGNMFRNKKMLMEYIFKVLEDKKLLAQKKVDDKKREFILFKKPEVKAEKSKKGKKDTHKKK